MKAIIVAGGIGERLRPITNNIPKPMVEVNGKPILLHIINLFKRYGVTDFVIAVCYLPKVITDFFGNGTKFGIDIQYTFENPQKPLGAAGAITLSKKFISDTFFVTYADILRNLDIKKMLDFHNNNKAFATINTYKRISKNAKSIVSIGKGNRVIKFTERPIQEKFQGKYIWANGSFYIFEPDIFDFIPENEKIDFGKDVFPKIVPDKKVYAYPTSGYFVDIGSLEKLESARQTFSN